MEEEEDEANLNLVMTLHTVEPPQDLPIVEPLQQPIPPTPEEPATHAVNSLTFDNELEFPEELAFLIGHKDGIVRGHTLTPIPIDNNQFAVLPTINDMSYSLRICRACTDKTTRGN